MKTYIVALNSSQFLEHCRMNALKPGPDLQYISRPSAMDRIAVEDKIEFLPGAEEREDYAAMMDKYHVWVTRRTGTPVRKPERTYVVARRQSDYRRYAEANKLRHNEVEDIVSADRLRGISSGRVVFLDGSEGRSDYPRLVEQALTLAMAGRITVEHDVPVPVL